MIAIVKPYKDIDEKIISGLTTRDEVHDLLGETYRAGSDDMVELYVAEGDAIGMISIVPFPSHYIYYAIVIYDDADRVASIKIDSIIPGQEDRLLWMPLRTSAEEEKLKQKIEEHRAISAKIVIEADSEEQLQKYWNDKELSRYIALCRAADLKHPDARYRLGMLYESGAEIMSQDYVKSLYWYMMAVKAGSYWSKISAEHLAERLTPDEIEQAEYMVENWQSGQCEHSLNLSGALVD